MTKSNIQGPGLGAMTVHQCPGFQAMTVCLSPGFRAMTVRQGPGFFHRGQRHPVRRWA